MKPLVQLCAASVLTLALAFSAFAGHAECPGVVDPPPPTAMDTPLTQAIVIVIADVLSLS
jgi:hypothetical protein